MIYRIVHLVFSFFIISNVVFAQDNSKETITFNKQGSSLVLPKIQVIPIKDSKTGRAYELYIKLPNDYSENSSKSYPVLYYTDALWHVEMLSAATEYMLEDVILVGISWQKNNDSSQKNEVGEYISRLRDYSITKSSNLEKQSKYQFGEANKHLDFIRDDVIYYIENSYRTDPNSRTYFGYSLGGKFGAYILVNKPDTFDNYILGSPSIKKDISVLSDLSAKFGPYQAAKKETSIHANVYISYGALEKKLAVSIEAFISLLKDRKDAGLSVFHEVVDGNHNSAFPLTGVRSIAWLSTAMQPVSSIPKTTSFKSIPNLNNAFVSLTPEDRKDGVLVDTLSVNKQNNDAIVKLSQEIFEGQYGNYDALLIAHKNKLVFESYYKKGRINVPHGQASAVKGYTSLIVGRAIQMGYLTMEDLNKPLVNFLSNTNAQKYAKGIEKITLHKALTMQGGITIDNNLWKEIKKDSVRLKGQGFAKTVFELSDPITSKSQRYRYGNFNPMLVMTVIDTVVPGTAKDFIKNEFLDKLGIANYKWSTHISGMPEAGWNASMLSRDMLKIGNLVLNNGKLNGEQLIFEEYLAKATSNMVKPNQDWMPKNYRYGYFWYQARIKVGENSYNSRFAWGGGGQRIVVIDELELTIVISGHDKEDDKLFPHLFEVILPAFEDNGTDK